MVGSNTPTRDKHKLLMSYNKQLMETLVADCDQLRRKNFELIYQIEQQNNQLQSFEIALKALQDAEPSTGSDALKLEDLMASLQDSKGDIEEAITDAIYNIDSSDLEDFINVELSLNGNEIGTELETSNRYAIERFVRNYISDQMMEKLEMGIAHYFEHLTPKADDSI
jgi:transcription termination factor NusB